MIMEEHAKVGILSCLHGDFERGPSGISLLKLGLASMNSGAKAPHFW
jgi:hypothetical protein